MTVFIMAAKCISLMRMHIFVFIVVSQDIILKSEIMMVHQETNKHVEQYNNFL